MVRAADIKCKEKRKEVYRRERREKGKVKKEAREDRKKEAEALGDEVRALVRAFVALLSFSAFGGKKNNLICFVLSCSQAAPKQIPKTLENTREHDETVVRPDDEEVSQLCNRTTFYFIFLLLKNPLF
jgi:hypothetical protein